MAVYADYSGFTRLPHSHCGGHWFKSSIAHWFTGVGGKIATAHNQPTPVILCLTRSLSYYLGMSKRRMVPQLVECWRTNERYASRVRGDRQATAIAVGVTREYYSALVAENSRIMPNLDLVLRLAHCHGFTVDEMMSPPAVFVKLASGKRPATSELAFKRFVCEYLDLAPRGTQVQLATAIGMSAVHLSRMRRSIRDKTAPNHAMQFDSALKIAQFLRLPLGDMCLNRRPKLAATCQP